MMNGHVSNFMDQLGTKKQQQEKNASAHVPPVAFYERMQVFMLIVAQIEGLAGLLRTLLIMRIEKSTFCLIFIEHTVIIISRVISVHYVHLKYFSTEFKLENFTDKLGNTR